jgi:hypothetical protein
MTIEGITFSPHSCAPGWYAAAIRGVNAKPVEADALRIQRSAMKRGYFSVCGFLDEESGYRVFLVPSNDVLAVLRVFEVGKRAADYDPDGHDRAVREIEAVHERCPLIPFFADSACFKARFAGAVSEEVITFLETALSAAEPMMDDDDGSIAGYVRTQKGIHLWWD